MRFMPYGYCDPDEAAQDEYEARPRRHDGCREGACAECAREENASDDLCGVCGRDLVDGECPRCRDIASEALS